MPIPLKSPFVPGACVAGLFFLIVTAAALQGCPDKTRKAASDKAGVDAVAPTPEAVKTTEGNGITARSGDPVSGKAIYGKYCHFCHGLKGEGDGPIGIAITPRPADLIHDKSRLSKTDEQLFYSISEGIRRETGGREMAMPRWKDILTEKQRWDVLSYIRQLGREYGGNNRKDSP